MHRIVSLIAVIVLTLAGVLVAQGRAAAVGYSSAPLAKKVCKAKKVHGKKKKVCTRAKPKSSPTPFPTPATELSSGDQVDAWLTQNKFSGYVYLERHGQVILSKGYGMADSEDKVPNTAQTKWPAFNENRFLVALAIMRLQEQGKLSVQDKLCSYISRCPAAWQPITVEELMLNTSGIARYNPFAPGVTVDQTTADCKAMPLASSPGTHSPWSECNAFLLSTILQQVTGQNWADAMQELVFGPAGMTNSGRMTNALKPPQRGRFYLHGHATPELNYDGTYFAYTTMQDMVTLNHALLAGKVVSRQSLDAMFTSRGPADPNDPNSPLIGYEVVMLPATATMNKAVEPSNINGNGEDEAGLKAGFIMDISLSPDDGAIADVLSNDDASFNDNHFLQLIAKLMWGK